MSTTVQRLKEYIDYKGLSVRKFEESIGFSNGAFSVQYKNNRTIGSDKLERVLQVYKEINPTWLLKGEGNMLLEPYDGANGESGNVAYNASFPYVKVDEYKDRYIAELEEQVKVLRKENQTKQELIDGFLSGKITTTVQ